MEIITIYESASSDGYHHTGDGEFYLDKELADQAAKNRHAGYAVPSTAYAAIKTPDGRYLLLRSITPVSIVGTTQAIEDIAKAAMAKLSDTELAALGLKRNVERSTATSA